MSLVDVLSCNNSSQQVPCDVGLDLEPAVFLCILRYFWSPMAPPIPNNFTDPFTTNTRHELLLLFSNLLQRMMAFWHKLFIVNDSLSWNFKCLWIEELLKEWAFKLLVKIHSTFLCFFCISYCICRLSIWGSLCFLLLMVTTIFAECCNMLYIERTVG